MAMDINHPEFMDPRIAKINDEYAEREKQRDIDYAKYLEDGRIWGLVPKCRIQKITFPRVSKELCDGFLELQDMTTTISDVLDGYGINGMIPSSFAKPVIPGKKVCGTAVTIRNVPERKTPTQGYIDHDMIKMSTRDIYYLCEKGDILVCDFGGELSTSNMGGMSALVAQTRGLAANIVYGCCRDVPTIRENGYPVWSAGTTMITGKFRMECMEMNGPVTLFGKRVEAGDMIAADDNGVVIVPAEIAADVLEKCREQAEVEANMDDAVRKDLPLVEVRKWFRKRYK